MTFEAFRQRYPKRNGGQRWGDAERFFNALLKKGHTTEEIIAGVERYKAWCDATGKTGTELVQQAATFLGRNKGFLEDWAIPGAAVDMRRERNKSVARNWAGRS